MERYPLVEHVESPDGKGDEDGIVKLADVFFAPTLPDSGTGIPQQVRYLAHEGIGHRQLRSPQHPEADEQEEVYDLQTAGLMHTHSTGHGHRGYSSLPIPDYTNLVIQPGNIPYQKMIDEMDEGVIVHQVLGSGQSNILAGDFSLNIDLGFKIQNGQIVGRVKDTMVSGNIFTAFKKIGALSQEVENSGNLIAPYILLDQINITSAEES